MPECAELPLVIRQPASCKMSGEKDPYPSDLFVFDRDSLEGEVLLHDGVSHLRYQEYAVYAQESNHASTTQSSETNKDQPFLKHISHYIISKDSNGNKLFHQAMREDQSIDNQGNWGQNYKGLSHLLQGRMRQIICHRRINYKSSKSVNLDGLHLTSADFNLMGLHPATLQYIRRNNVESLYWDRHHEKISVIISFPSDPRAPYDFLSMTHSILDRTTTILVRQSFDVNQHNVKDLNQYEKRMQTCRSHWVHPLIIPIILLQVQFIWIERAMAKNHSKLITVKKDVRNMAGFDTFNNTKRQWQTSSSAGVATTGQYYIPPGHHHNGGVGSQTGSGQQQQVYKKSTELMKNAHDILQRSIRLLDALHWIDRAIKILLEAGDALDDIYQDSSSPPLSSTTGFLKARVQEDLLTSHWHEIRQYLDGLLQLCMSLKTDQTILEMRCKSLVDMVSWQL